MDTGMGKTTKKCTRCLEWKAHSAFWKNAQNKSGLNSCCIECKKEMDRASRARKRAKKRQPLDHSEVFLWDDSWIYA